MGAQMLKVDFIEGRRWLVDATGSLITPIRSFCELAGSLRGDNAFIAASGSSARDFPWSKYNGYPFIAMNGSIVACVENNIVPKFYLCDDESFARDRFALALLGLERAQNVAMSLEVLSSLHAAQPGCLAGRSVFLLERVNRFIDRKRLSDRAYAWSIRNDQDLISQFSLIRKSPNRVGFSLNLDKGYFVARTIPYVALQLCYQLGCRRNFLIGVDLSRGGGRFYEAGTDVLPTSLDEDFDKYILPSFLWMRRRVVSAGFQVFNLSPISRLPETLFPRLTDNELESMLESSEH